jgi:hypothetical protein
MQQTSTEILATPARQYPGWHFRIRCEDCGTYNAVPITDLSDRLQSLPVAEVLRRLWCRRCGCREQKSVELRHRSVGIFLIGDASNL